MQQKRLLKRTVMACMILVGVGISYYHVSQSKSLISSYVPARDRADIIKLFRQDIDWLTTNKDYSPEFMVDNMAPNEWDTRYFGKFHIDVLREKNNAFVGFVGYYKLNFRYGRLLFLAVRPEFRGKRYGQQLVLHGIKKLFGMGVSVVKMLTYEHNQRSQALYNRLGFPVSYREPGFVHYEIRPQDVGL